MYFLKNKNFIFLLNLNLNTYSNPYLQSYKLNKYLKKEEDDDDDDKKKIRNVLKKWTKILKMIFLYLSLKG